MGLIDRDCALILDVMHIKARTQYNQSLDHYDGFVDFGTYLDLGEDFNSDKLATQVIVFKLVGLKGR